MGPLPVEPQKKNLIIFHYPGCLMGIPTMEYEKTDNKVRFE